MTALAQRKSKLTFETGDHVREAGRLRAVVIECENTFAYVRLKGTRTRYQVEWSAMYSVAVKQHVAALKAEKKAKRLGAR